MTPDTDVLVIVSIAIIFIGFLTFALRRAKKKIRDLQAQLPKPPPDPDRGKRGPNR